VSEGMGYDAPPAHLSGNHQQMQKPLIPLILALNCALLSGCANWEFPWVYRINVDQGNIITQEKVNQLKPGMSREQVKFVMGSPLLTDTFHDDRWDYLYTLRDRDNKNTKHRLTVVFAGDKLAQLSGDFMPQAEAVPPAANDLSQPANTNDPAFQNPSAAKPNAVN
jgi:outer membrane protein assembly factor BamE